VYGGDDIPDVLQLVDAKFGRHFPDFITTSHENEKPRFVRTGAFHFYFSRGLQAGVNGAEHIADERAHDGEGGDDDNGDQNEDQRVLNHALAFFLE
jgi:hypothetical protein